MTATDGSRPKRYPLQFTIAAVFTALLLLVGATLIGFNYFESRRIALAEAAHQRIHEIRMRFEVLWRDAQIPDYKGLMEGEIDEPRLRERLERQQAAVLDDFAFVAECNLGDDPMTPERTARLERISRQTWVRHLDDTLGLSHLELSLRGEASGPPAPVVEPVLADRPEHVIPRTNGAGPGNEGLRRAGGPGRTKPARGTRARRGLRGRFSEPSEAGRTRPANLPGRLLLKSGRRPPGMPYLELTGLTRIPLLVLERAADLGLDREQLLAGSGLTHQELSNPDGRVPLSKISGLWQAAVEQSPDPSFGLHLGESVDIREIGLVGYVLLHSRTAREALQRLVRYSRVIQEALKIKFEEDAAGGTLSFARIPLMDRIHHPVDARLAVSITLTRKLTGADVVPVEVGFPYPRPDDTSEHRRVFRAPLKFDCPDAYITFARVDLDRSIVAADETLVTYLDRLAEEFLESLSRGGTYSEKVRRAVWTDLSDGHPTLEGAATRIGVSPRSLQRRLREEGTTFAEILDDLRHRMAMYLLRDQHLAVYEVAFLLGYSEPSTFFRAFRRWESKSPREYRSATEQDEAREVPEQPLPSF